MMLEKMLRAYLHQDYDLRYGSVEAALRAFREDASDNERHAAVEEIDTLLAAYPVDRLLYEQLRRRGFIFYPPRDGETTRAWLERTRAVLTQPT